LKKKNEEKTEKSEKEISKSQKNTKSKLKTKKKSKRKLKLIIFFILLIIFIIFNVVTSLKWQSLAADMMLNTNSTILDKHGNLIAEIGSEKIRKNISIDNIPENLKNAYISIEDERYYSHSGVDIKRTGAAIANYITNHSDSFGGSTITQQLVKNISVDNSSTISRKIREWYRAISLEMKFSKDEILETYLNVIYVGPNIYGVEAGANYYFDKTVSELNLEECAFLAGINHLPNSYNPYSEYDHSEKIQTRTKTVLDKMLELGHITQEEHQKALSNLTKGLKFKKDNSLSTNSSSVYSYHTDALLTEVIEDIAEEKDISIDFATNYLKMAGLKIYSTQDATIQKSIEKEFRNSKYIVPSEKTPSATSQAAMVIIDHKTGYVVGCVGGLGNKETSRCFNRATQALRQTGSAIKPLAVLVPGIDKKIVTASTILDDSLTTFEDDTDDGYTPINNSNYLGKITLRRALESSQNVPFVSVMQDVTPKTSIKYMEKMGITTLTKQDRTISLALGGLHQGITPLETAGAYATIANKGTYIEPTFYEKILDSSGNILFGSHQKSREVFSEETAYILTNLLTQPVTGEHGTAKSAVIPNIDVACKTGTTNKDYDKWNCGFTPYYTAVTWYGYDTNETIVHTYHHPTGVLWSDVMKSIHANLKPASFEVPTSNQLKTVLICNDTGMQATESCSSSYIEYFLEGTVPKTCTEH